MHAKLLSLRALRTLSIPGPTCVPLSFGYAVLALCTCAVRFLPLIHTLSALDSRPCSCTRRPPFPLLFLLLGTQLLGRLLVEWIPSPPPFSSLHSSSRRERTVANALPTSWLANVSLPLCLHFLARCTTTSVHHYKMPCSPPSSPSPLESEAELQNTVIRGTRVISQRWLCNLRRRDLFLSKKFKSTVD